MAQSRVTSVAAEVLAIPLSQARVSSVAAEVLATASSKARLLAEQRFLRARPGYLSIPPIDRLRRQLEAINFNALSALRIGG